MTEDQERPRTEAEVEEFLADLEDDQADRRELENDDDLKATDRSPSSRDDTSPDD